MSNEDTPKLAEEEFIRRAIKKLRGKHKGIHTVYSGFNDAFNNILGLIQLKRLKDLLKQEKLPSGLLREGY